MFSPKVVSFYAPTVLARHPRHRIDHRRWIIDCGLLWVHLIGKEASVGGLVDAILWVRQSLGKSLIQSLLVYGVQRRASHPALNLILEHWVSLGRALYDIWWFSDIAAGSTFPLASKLHASESKLSKTEFSRVVCQFWRNRVLKTLPRWAFHITNNLGFIQSGILRTKHGALVSLHGSCLCCDLIIASSKVILGQAHLASSSYTRACCEILWCFVQTKHGGLLSNACWRGKFLVAHDHSHLLLISLSLHHSWRGLLSCIGASEEVWLWCEVTVWYCCTRALISRTIIRLRTDSLSKPRVRRH